MAFWHRFRNPNLKTLCFQFQRCYIHLPHASAPKPSPMEIPHPYSVFHGRPTSVFNTVRFFAVPVQFQVKPKNEEEDSGGYRMNEKIKSPYVRLVVDEGHSIVSKFEALERAKKLKLDLVEVDKSAEPPVCKIMDFHKEMYKRKQWEKERAKTKAEMTLRKDIKEVRFSEKTEANDLKNKADMIKKLMEKGYRVKCKVSGKENQDLTVLFSPLLALMEDVCIIESGPHMSKKDAFMIVRHIKFGLSKKSGKKFTDATHVKVEEGNMETFSANSSGSIEHESHAESEFETEEVLSDAFSYNADMIASPSNQTNAAPEATFRSRSNDPVSPPLSDNRYRRTNHPGENKVQSNVQVPPAVSDNRYRRTNHPGENKVQSNVQVPPAVTENRYKRVEPRNRFQQTPNNIGMNYQGPGTRDAVRPTPPNWNRTRHAPGNDNPRIENNNQGFTPPGSRHSMPSHENVPRHPPCAPNTPPTTRPGYGIFNGSKGPETQSVNARMHRNREGNQ